MKILKSSTKSKKIDSDKKGEGNPIKLEKYGISIKLEENSFVEPERHIIMHMKAWEDSGINLDMVENQYQGYQEELIK